MIDDYINETVDADYINSIPIEHLTKDELIELTEKAKENNILVILEADSTAATTRV